MGQGRQGRHQVVFVGAATVDSIALVARFPHPDQRVVAEELTSAGGGPAATAAVAAARLGVDCAFIGAVGDDPDGRRIVADLQDEGVDCSLVRVAAGQRSGASVIVVDRGRGTRAICARPGPDIEVAHAAHVLRSADWVHTDHAGWASVTAVLSPEAGGPRLSVDAGNPIPGFSPRGVDLYAPTVAALRASYGELATEALLDAALADGAARVVATDGGRGCFGADADGQRAHAPGVPVEVVSTLGAGDVFHGALVAAHVRGLRLGHALRYANATAALSCRGLDGRSAIPTHDTVDASLRARTA
ncbi:MAG TPA: PfkB family carbohydrate kinase [Dermatophilaceae bacterium]|nr:PfkB family carbohydrate kinase [Dermatophilaceae bacterium]